MMFLMLSPLRYLTMIMRIVVLGCLLTVAGILVFAFYPDTHQVASISSSYVDKIPFAYEFPLEYYSRIGKDLLTLELAPSRLSHANLKQEFVFYGCNDRPDSESNPMQFIGLRGNSDIAALSSNRRYYLANTQVNNKKNYLFTEEKKTGALWIEVDASEQEAHVRLGIEEDSSSVPIEFNLKPEPRPAGWKTWEIGAIKVDNSILARQKARWSGQDLFLMQHGGDAFALESQKQRIDFGENSTAYSCFVNEGDCLVWREDRWVFAAPEMETHGLTLLQAKRIEDRLMHISLWSPDGKSKLTLSLIKSPDISDSSKLAQAFVYVGQKSWNEWIFEINGKRQIVKPKDWWLRQDNSWKKLTTKEDIDDYTQLKKRGELLVIGKVIQKDRKRVLTSFLFNAQRTKVSSIEFSMNQHKPMTGENPPPEDKDKKTPDPLHPSVPMELKTQDQKISSPVAFPNTQEAAIKASPPTQGRI